MLGTGAIFLGLLFTSLHLSLLAWDRYADALVPFLVFSWIWAMACLGVDVLLDMLGVDVEKKAFAWASVILAFIGYLAVPVTYFMLRVERDFSAFEVAASPVVAVRPSAAPSSPLIALLSDTHVTDRWMTSEGRRVDEQGLEQLLRSVGDAHPRLLLVTGDLTDLGSAPEWQRFDRALAAAFSSRADRPIVLLEPGNHDLQGSPYRDPAWDAAAGFDDPFGARVAYLKRAFEFERLMKRWEPSLRPVAPPPAGAPDFAALVDAMSTSAARAEAKPVSVPRDGGMARYHLVYPADFTGKLDEAERRFAALFPFRYEDPSTGTYVVILNSSARVGTGSNMAIGALLDPQLQRLDDYLRRVGADRHLKRLVVAMHHAPVRRETDAWSWRQFFFRFTSSDIYAHSLLSLEPKDARRLVDRLEAFAAARHDAQVVLVYGHRHEKYLGRTRAGVWAVESPAAVEMGSDKPAGFWGIFEQGSAVDVQWLQ